MNPKYPPGGVQRVPLGQMSLFRPTFTLLRVPNLWARYRLMRDVHSFVRLHFLYSALDCGLLRALKTPASQHELTEKLAVKRPELLEAFLKLGVSLGELSLKNGVYRLEGKLSMALVGPNGDPLEATIEEMLSYHASVYQRLASRLRGAPPGDYLNEASVLIARSSRILEPIVAGFAKAVVKGKERVRLLEVGCGFGVYLKYAAETNPNVTGIATDMQEEVVRQATANLEQSGLAGRFQVITADVRKLPANMTGPFDLITLYNNVYYFDPEERPALFQKLKSCLASDGVLAIVSMMLSRVRLSETVVDLR